LAALEQGLDLFRQLGDVWGMARSSQIFGGVFLTQGNYEKARVYFEQQLRLDEELQFKQGTVVALSNLGDLHRYQGDDDQAMCFYEKSLMMSREYGYTWDLSHSVWCLGLVALHRNDYRLAGQQFTDCYSLARTIYSGGTSECDLFTGLAAVAAGTNQPERAAKLYGAAQALFETTDYRIPPFDQAEFDRHLQIAREQLGDVTFERLAAEGRAIPMDQAIELALQETN
jgi:tetratricopeptide (TPR) repeat protein